MLRFILMIAIFLIVLVSQASARAQGLVAQSDHFTLISDASLDAQELLTDLEDLQRAVRRDLGLNEKMGLQPLRLNIIGDPETFALVSPGGNPAGIYRQSAVGSDIIVGYSDLPGHWLSGGLSPDSLKLVLRHELVHHILETHYPRRLPLWALEGLAEYYATYQADGLVLFGEHITGQKVMTDETVWLPIKTIIESRTQYPDFPAHLHTSLYRPQQLFYAQSMAIAQFIIEQPDGFSKLHDFIDAWEPGADTEANFTKIFGIDYTALKARLQPQNEENPKPESPTSLRRSFPPSIIQSEPGEGQLLANQLRLAMTYGQPDQRTDDYIASLRARLTPTEAWLSADSMLLAEAIYAWRDQDWTSADTLTAMVLSTNPESPEATKLRSKIAYGRLGDEQDDAMMWREAENATRDALLYQPDDAELHLFRVAVSRPDEGHLSSRSLRSLNWLADNQTYLRHPHMALMMIPALLHEDRFSEALAILDNAERWADTASDRALITGWRGRLRQARMR